MTSTIKQIIYNKQTMEIKEQINTLLQKVGLKAVEVKLEQMKLDDGTTVIEAEVFEADQPVMIVTEDEQMIPLPVGEYTMEDGRMLIVQEEGVIFEIKEAQTEEEEQPVEEAPVAASEKPQVAPVAKKVVESVSKESYFSKEDFDALKAEIETLKTELSAMKEPKVEEVEEEVKPITHNPENKVEMSINVQGGGLVEFLNNKLNK